MPDRLSCALHADMLEGDRLLRVQAVRRAKEARQPQPPCIVPMTFPRAPRPAVARELNQTVTMKCVMLRHVPS